MTTMVNLRVSLTQASIILGAIESDIDEILRNAEYDDEQKVWLIGEREILHVNICSQLEKQGYNA